MSTIVVWTYSRSLGENPALELIAVLVLMAIWGGAILAVDHWVWSGHLWPKRPSKDAQGKAGP